MVWYRGSVGHALSVVVVGMALFSVTVDADAQALGFVEQRPFVIAYEPVIGRDGSVGGVSIDADGVVSTVGSDVVRGLADTRKRVLMAVPEKLGGLSSMRKVSLARLEAAVAATVKEKRPLADEMRFLGGLQRIRYVFVYPEQNDIVLAGPGEGWALDPGGTPVGVTTGRPVMLLDDLLVALRSMEKAREERVSCSIEPTPEGRRRFEAYMRRQRQFSPAVVSGIEKTLGPQQVLVTGVPATSHFARVMVAGDYRMKRIAMHLEKSPVGELPSYLDLLRSARDVDRNMMPRWWLASDFEPLGCSRDGLAWELRGRGIKAMTEDDLVATDGSVARAGRASRVAQEWADRMNAHYDELVAKAPVFGQLRNLMDVCVVAALLDRYDLVDRAGCSLPYLTRSDSPLGTVRLHAPKSVATQCSYLKRGSNWIITASGGIEIDGPQIVERRKPDDNVVKLRHEAAPPANAAWCWN